MYTGNDQFHDSKSDDIYDLYNACNGELRDGVLDLSKLDELSDEEREVFDVRRLKAFGAHVISGCTQCESIINTLNWARRELKKGPLKRGPLNEIGKGSPRDELDS